MIKKTIFISILFIFLLLKISAQSPAPLQQFTKIGDNFDQLCAGTSCTTTLYSYDKYFNRNGVWETIDENWYSCGQGFCTKDYYFNTTANSQGLVTSHLYNAQLSMQLSNFLNQPLTFNPIIQGSIIKYENIINGVDLQYQYSPRRLKEEIVIKEPLQNLAQNNFNITFITSGADGFNIEEPYICDNSNNCQDISYQTNPTDIILEIPVSFLSNANNYPIIIDPTISLNHSFISWNGYAQNNSGTYTRNNNPRTLDLGKLTTGARVGAMDWNIANLPDQATIFNVSVQFFVENVLGNNFLALHHLEHNSSFYLNNNSGNLAFYSDILNGSIYAQDLSVSHSNQFLNLSFSPTGITDLQNALALNVFSFGINTNVSSINISIAARDSVNASHRPILIVNHSYEQYNLTYDANGNLINGFNKIFTYDSWNRLVEVNYSDNRLPIARYWYDHTGTRIKKITYNIDSAKNNVTTYYPFKEFVHTRITNGTIFNETYVYLYDKLIAKIEDNGKKLFYHPDHLGSTSLVTNESGDVVQKISYLPFGKVLAGSEEERYLYTGKEWDKESELLYYGARYYDPEFSRFLQPDPVIQDVYDPQNLNHYSYVLNNPYKYVDPSGNLYVLAGTISFGVSGAIGAIFGQSAGIGVSYNFDSNSLNQYGTIGDSITSPQAEGSVEFGYYPFNLNGDISGESREYGVSIPSPSIGLGVSSPFNEKGGFDLRNLGVKVGVGIGAAPYSASITDSQTTLKKETNTESSDQIRNKIRGVQDYYGINLFFPGAVQTTSPEEGNGRSTFADGNGANPGPNVGSSGSSSSGSGSSSSGGSSSGSSGSNGGWWCFGGILC